jgi:hypothetical protein
MKNSFKNYEAVGPLGYLLMDNDGNMQLGLYKKIGHLKMVLILKYKSDYFVINTTQEKIDAFFRDEILLIDMAFDGDKNFITDTDNNEITNEQVSEIYNYIVSQISGNLSKQLFFTTYPNYYYLYRDWLGVYQN